MKTTLTLMALTATFCVLALSSLAEDLTPSQMAPHGSAPGLKSRLLSETNDTKEYILIFEKGDELISGITSFAADHKIKSAQFHGIGALKTAVFGSFDAKAKSYHIHRLNDQSELLSLTGDIALFGNKPVVHAHAVMADQEGKAVGGHLVEGVVFPTTELFLRTYSKSLIKKTDPETDLKLIHPEVVTE